MTETVVMGTRRELPGVAGSAIGVGVPAIIARVYDPVYEGISWLIPADV